MMKHCDGLGGICLVCCMYTCLVLECVFVFFWICRLMVCLGVHSSVLCWSFYCNILVFLFDIKRLNILYILKAAWGVCAYMQTGCLGLSTRDVTKHRDQSLSPTGISWVSDGVSINSREIYAY